MTEVAEFPNLEVWLTGWLRTKLDARTEPFTTGVVVDHLVPNPRPARLVQVRRDGGPKVNPLTEAARVGVNVWAATEFDADELARLTRAILSGAAGQGPVKRVTETTGPSPVPDVVPRKYFTVELLVHGSIITV
jgi:hypothetical protein